MDDYDALNRIEGHMGTGDLGRLTEGRGGMFHREWNNTDGRARSIILVSTTDPVPARASFETLRYFEAPRYASAPGVRTRRSSGPWRTSRCTATYDCSPTTSSWTSAPSSSSRSKPTRGPGLPAGGRGPPRRRRDGCGDDGDPSARGRSAHANAHLAVGCPGAARRHRTGGGRRRSGHSSADPCVVDGVEPGAATGVPTDGVDGGRHGDERNRARRRAGARPCRALRARTRRSRRFYRDVLGLRELGLGGLPFPAAMFSSGRTHHELLLIEVGPDAAPIPSGRRVGMYHFGLKVGDTDDELRAALARCNRPAPSWAPATTVSPTACTSRSRRNEIELYIDVAGVDWDDPEVLSSRPQALRL